MPIDYEIEDGLLRTRCVGDVTWDEVMAHFDELVADPLRPPELDVLLDMSAMESLPSTDQIKGVASRMQEIGAVRFRACAIVAANDALFGMVRMLEVFAERVFSQTMVFRELPPAERWLEEVRNVGG